MEEKNPLHTGAMACLNEERLPGCPQQNPVLYINPPLQCEAPGNVIRFHTAQCQLLPLTLKVTISLLLSLQKLTAKPETLLGNCLPAQRTETLSFQASVLSKRFYKGVFVCLMRLRPQRSWKSRLAAGLEGFNGGGDLGCLHMGALQLKSQS